MNSMLACCMPAYVSRQVAASMSFSVHSQENFTAQLELGDRPHLNFTAIVFDRHRGRVEDAIAQTHRHRIARHQNLAQWCSVAMAATERNGADRARNRSLIVVRDVGKEAARLHQREVRPMEVAPHRSGRMRQRRLVNGAHAR